MVPGRHRGLAISLALTGGCLGQYVIVPVSAGLVFTQGWRTSFMFIGITILCVNLIVAHFLIKEKPQDIGLYPNGRSSEPKPSPATEKQLSAVARSTDMNLTEAMHTAPFWFYLMVMFVCGGGDYLVLTHLIPMVTDYGISAISAGKMLGWSGFFSLIGVLLAGPVADRFGNKKVVVVTFLLRALIFLMVWRYQNLISFYLFAFAFGFTLLITAPITTTLVGKLYGFAHVGAITGFITTVHHLSGGLWAWLGGVIFDSTGSYQTAFLLSALFAFIAFGCAVMIKEKRICPRNEPL